MTIAIIAAMEQDDRLRTFAEMHLRPFTTEDQI